VDDTTQFLNPEGIRASQNCTLEEAHDKLQEVAQDNSQLWVDLQWLLLCI
jgi:hypothetical protein